MTTISQPSVNVSIVSAVTEVPNDEQRVLFVGQKTASGTATAGVLVTNIQDDASWDTLFGETSMLAEMLRNARLLNKVSRFDAIPLADNGTTFAVHIISLTGGAASGAGTTTATIGSKQNHSVSVAIPSGRTPTEMAGDLRDAINADSTMPFTATSSPSVTTLTADNAGTFGNVGIEAASDVPNVNSITATTTTAGATDPVLTSVLDVIGDIRYQTIVWPYATPAQLAPLLAVLDPRFNSSIDVLDGVGITAAVDTLANLQSDYASFNSESLVILGDTSSTVAGAFLDVPSIFEISAVKAAMVGAIRALRRTEGASIAQFLAGEVGLDAFGGPALSARPYFNTPIPNIPISVLTEGFTATEIEALFDDGITVIGSNTSQTGLILGETPTTYKTDTAGNPDLSFKFLNFVDTASAVREYFTNNLKTRFAQSRLTEGDLVPGRPMANAQLILATLVEFYSTLSGPQFALTQAGETARSTFVANTTVTLDLATGTVTVLMDEVPLVTQLRVINATMTISFSANG